MNRILVIVVLMTIPHSLLGQSADQVNALMGIQAIVPSVRITLSDELGGSEVLSGLQSSGQVEFELALRREGIRVIDLGSEPATDVQGRIALVTLLHSCTGIEKTIACLASFQVKEGVVLGQSKHMVITYQDVRPFAAFDMEMVHEIIKGSSEHRIREFLNDFLTANPKGGG